MPKINPYFSLLTAPYIFPVIEKKLESLKNQGLRERVINLGIGDVALPLAPGIAKAICQATEEMTDPEKIRGYGPSEGYDFLREAICKNEYKKLQLTPEEIFVSDGINTDIAGIQELFALDCKIAIMDPTYPVYLASNIMAGRKENVTILPCTKENDFLPTPPLEHYDLIYLCSPSNPTGVAMNRDKLKQWVDYALKTDAIIILDNAYAAFVRSPDVPSSIYEIEGAHQVAIECRSFSKSAGFTGLRCSYTLVPKTLPHNLHAMWRRRHVTKFNGVAYPIQRGAEATFSQEVQAQIRAQVDSYLESGRILRNALEALNQEFYGGVDAPYIWWKTPDNLSSWEFFDLVLEKCQILGIPGLGFGVYGEGYLRLSTFTLPQIATEAASRLSALKIGALV